MSPPKTTLSWVCNESVGKDGRIQDLVRLEEVRLPKLRPGYALVRVDAAPVNPSDVMFIRGQYGVTPKSGDVPGFEGSGTVLAANAGPYGWWLKGKQVSFGGQQGHGSWTQFAVVPVFSCIPVSSKMSPEVAGTLIVNPMTAIGLMAKAKRHRAKAIVMNAAGSSLGRYIVPLAKRQGIRVIGIVRRPEVVDGLLEAGASHVLDSSANDFDDQFRALTHEVSATVLFDAVAGDQTGQLLKGMPDRSLAIVYGQLSQQDDRGQASFDPDDLIFRGKRIDGYWLTQELRGLSGVYTPLLRARTIAKLYRKKVFPTLAVRATNLEDLAEFAERGVQDHKVVYIRSPSV